MDAELNPPPPERLYRYDQVRAILGDLSKSQLHRLIRAGDLTPLKLGKQARRISSTDLQAYLQRLKDAESGKSAA